jgi:hypothetical protein
MGVALEERMTQINLACTLISVHIGFIDGHQAGYLDFLLKNMADFFKSKDTLLYIDLFFNNNTTYGLTTETVSKCSFFSKVKEGKNFNHRNTHSISRIKI